jgi:hypothetical protein
VRRYGAATVIPTYPNPLMVRARRASFFRTSRRVLVWNTNKSPTEHVLPVTRSTVQLHLRFAISYCMGSTCLLRRESERGTNTPPSRLVSSHCSQVKTQVSIVLRMAHGEMLPTEQAIARQRGSSTRTMRCSTSRERMRCSSARRRLLIRRVSAIDTIQQSAPNRV